MRNKFLINFETAPFFCRHPVYIFVYKGVILHYDTIKYSSTITYRTTTNTRLLNVRTPDNSRPECRLVVIAAGGALLTARVWQAVWETQGIVYTHIKLVLCDGKEGAVFLYPMKVLIFLTRVENAALNVLSYLFRYSLFL